MNGLMSTGAKERSAGTAFEERADVLAMLDNEIAITERQAASLRLMKSYARAKNFDFAAQALRQNAAAIRSGSHSGMGR